MACSVRTLTTGVDWPVSCIIDAAPTQSPALHMQKIGRGLRINPGTEDLIVFDHAGNTGRIGLVTDLHFDAMCCAHPGERSTFEKTAKPPTPCGKCGVMFTGVECPQCGYERRRPPCEIEYEDRKLVLVSGASPDSKQDKQKFFGMALRLAEIRGYKSGWAAVKFREKFGTWPRGIPEFPQDPDQAFLNWEKSRRIAYAKSRTRLEGAAA